MSDKLVVQKETHKYPFEHLNLGMTIVEAI